MPVPRAQMSCTKAAVSVSEMARMVSLSRSRFYDYIERGVFPWPMYSLTTRRPFYVAEAQQEILAVRQTGIGCNGEYVLFYERRTESPAPPQRASRRPANTGLLVGLQSLGLNSLTQAQVDAALASLFPGGTTGVAEDVVIRTVYRHLRCRNGA